MLATRIIHIYRAFLYSAFQRMSLYISFTLFYLFTRRGIQCSIIKQRLEGRGKKATDKYQTVSTKISLCTHNINSRKKKTKKKKVKNDRFKEKIRKTAKEKCRFRGEELLGPQASLRVTPCPPVPNHTKGAFWFCCLLYFFPDYHHVMSFFFFVFPSFMSSYTFGPLWYFSDTVLVRVSCLFFPFFFFFFLFFLELGIISFSLFMLLLLLFFFSIYFGLWFIYKML